MDEIDNTKSEYKRNLLNNAIIKYNLNEYSIFNEDIEKIDNLYIENNIIPENKLEDALHIAYATYYEFDILLSWNFKHLANINKQKSVNSINMTIGYNKPLLLLNPMEVIYEK
ncbi:MAG: hypothetical protein HZB41_03540 [Ignavibacteriae bacterium]|nr:hypothetical protein [Ignavibacteriota bacterium]